MHTVLRFLFIVSTLVVQTVCAVGSFSCQKTSKKKIKSLHLNQILLYYFHQHAHTYSTHTQAKDLGFSVLTGFFFSFFVAV